jgi:hypothetical protein
MDNITRINTRFNAMRESTSQPTRKGVKRTGNWSPQSASNKKSQFKMSDSDLESLLTMNVGRANAGSMFDVAQTSHNSENDLHEHDATLSSQNEFQSSQVPPNGQTDSANSPSNQRDNQRDNEEQLELITLLRQQSLTNQRIEELMSRGVRLSANPESLNLGALKAEFKDKLHEIMSNTTIDFTATLRDVPTFQKLPPKLEYYDELLALKTRLTDLLLRLQGGTLIPKAEFCCTINPAFIQLTNFREVANSVNELSYNLQFCQTGLHYVSILEVVESRIAEIKTTLLNPTESLAIFRNCRYRSMNQKLNTIFHKLRTDDQRNADIGGASTSLIQMDTHQTVQNNVGSNNDTIPKTANASNTNSMNRRHRSRSRSISAQRARSTSAHRVSTNLGIHKRNSDQMYNRQVSWAGNTDRSLNGSANQSRFHNDRVWVNSSTHNAMQSSRVENFGPRNNVMINERQVQFGRNTNRNSYRGNNHSFRNYGNYADDYNIESGSESGPDDFYYGPRAFHSSHK